MRRRALVALVLLAGLGAPQVGSDAPLPAARADSTVAEALVASGRKALARRQYDEAVSLFEKALEEEPDLISSAYWLGLAHDKADRPKDALAHYRQFEVLCAQVGDELSRADTSLRKKAEKRVASLAAGERQLDKLQDAFVKRLMIFARKHAVRDPAMAGKALRRVIEVAPRNDDARELADKLGVELDPAPPEVVAPVAAGPFDRMKVATWHDLIAKEAFSSKAIQTKGDTLTCDTNGGIVVASREDFGFGERLLYEMDVRLDEELQREWGIGLVLGWKNGNFLNVMLKKSEVLLNLGDPAAGPIEDLATHPMPSIKLEAYHRLGVKRDGQKLDVYLDGKRVFSHTVEDAGALKGEIAFFQQRCRTTVRQLRVGELE